MLILIDHMCLIKIVWWKGCVHFRHLTFLLLSIVGYLWVLSSRSFERTVIHSYLNNSPIFPFLSLKFMQMEKQVHDPKHSYPLSTSVSVLFPFLFPFTSFPTSCLLFSFPLLSSVHYMLTQICQTFVDEEKQIQVIKFLCLKNANLF